MTADYLNLRADDLTQAARSFAESPNLNTAQSLLSQAWSLIQSATDLAPEVEVVNVEEDGEEYEGLRCPHCHELPAEWAEMDSDYRLNYGETYGPDCKVVSFSTGDSEYQGLTYACGDCEQIVNLPGTIETTWC